MQKIPDRRFERSMNHNYMILSRRDFFETGGMNENDYRVKMLLENNIKGLLPVTHRKVNGESRYYYEINSLQSLDRILEKRELGCDEIKMLLMGCVRLFERLEEYLLDGSQVIIRPEFIYINVECMEPYFVCYPDYEGDVRLSFMEFTDELLTRIDHTDKSAVMLGYQVYRYTRNPNFVLSEIRTMMEHSAADMIKNNEQHEYEQLEDTNESSKAEYTFEPYKSDEENTAYDECEKQSCARDIAGCVLCVVIALCAAAIIVASRVMLLFDLGGNYELYLYGAIAMALMAAALFLTGIIRKVRYNRQIEELEEMQEIQSVKKQDDLPSVFSPKEPDKEPANYFCGETVCLQSDIVEERVLRGRIDDRELNIPLKNLPITVGKLAGVSDFVINDNTVSKMHARFEEHDGRVYVYDLNSTNGTLKNGELIGIDTPTRLDAGDKIRLGRISLTYC